MVIKSRSAIGITYHVMKNAVINLMIIRSLINSNETKNRNRKLIGPMISMIPTSHPGALGQFISR